MISARSVLRLVLSSPDRTLFSTTPLVPLAKGDAVRFAELQGVGLYLPVPLLERDTPPKS